MNWHVFTFGCVLGFSLVTLWMARKYYLAGLQQRRKIETALAEARSLSDEINFKLDRMALKKHLQHLPRG